MEEGRREGEERRNEGGKEGGRRDMYITELTLLYLVKIEKYVQN